MRFLDESAPITKQSSTSQTSDKEENFEVLQNQEDVTSSSKFGAFNNGTDTLLELSNFLERPVLLTTFNVPHNDPTFKLSFNPYTLWSRDTAVRARLKNYAYFRGNLKLHFLFNSNRFAYGAILISNQPYEQSNPTAKFYSTFNAGALSDRRIAANCYYFQSPESVLLKFNDDNNIVMDIPMIIPKKSIRLFNEGAGTIDNAIDYEQFNSLSTVVITVFNSLRYVNDETDIVPVRVYATMHDIEMGPATDTPITITAQSETMDMFMKFMEFKEKFSASNNPIANDIRDKVSSNDTLSKVRDFASKNLGDEYVDSGPVSSIATAVDTVASKLENVPIIGEAAKATSFVAKGVSKVAKFFGFSKPVNIDYFNHYKQFAFTNSSLVDNKDCAMKLSSDPKQELALASYSGEDDKDQLALPYITSKEGYFHTTLIDNNDPLGQSIVSLPLSPALLRPVVFSSESDPESPAISFIQNTPLSLASTMFRFWRGTITIRIEIVASQIHRGKLAVVYEPNSTNAVDILGKTLDLNRQYIYIMDLEQERNVEFDIGFAYDRTFAECYESGTNPFRMNNFRASNSPNRFYSPEAIQQTFDLGLNTGFVYVTRFTRISPNKPINMNLYVSSKDMQFGAPTNLAKMAISRDFTFQVERNRSITPDSPLQKFTNNNVAVRAQSSEAIFNRSGVSRVCLNDIQTDFKDIFLHNFGEKITSFRQLLKKDNVAFNLPAFTGIRRIRFPLYPPHSDDLPAIFTPADVRNIYSLPQTSERTKLGGDYISFNSPFNILRYAYLFCKGGMRVRVYTQSKNTLNSSYLYLNDSSDSADNLAPNQNSDENGIVGSFSTTTSSGSMMFDNNLTGIEVEVPYYSNDLFVLSARDSDVSKPFTAINIFENQQQSVRFGVSMPDSDSLVFSYSTAEDFNFFRYQGAPFQVSHIDPADFP